MSYPLSQPILKLLSMSVHPSVRPSVQKRFFFDFSEICYADRVMHALWPDLIQGHGQTRGSPKIAKMADFKVSPSAGVHVINRLMVTYDAPPRQYLNFNWTDYWHSSLFSVTWPSNLGVPPLANEFWPLTRSRPGSPVWGLFFICL